MCLIKIFPLCLCQKIFFSFLNCWVCDVVLHTKGFTWNIARFFVDHFLNHLSVGWLLMYGYCLFLFTGSYCLKSMINTCSCMYNIIHTEFLEHYETADQQDDNCNYCNHYDYNHYHHNHKCYHNPWDRHLHRIYYNTTCTRS